MVSPYRLYKARNYGNYSDWNSFRAFVYFSKVFAKRIFAHPFLITVLQAADLITWEGYFHWSFWPETICRQDLKKKCTITYNAVIFTSIRFITIYTVIIFNNLLRQVEQILWPVKGICLLMGQSSNLNLLLLLFHCTRAQRILTIHLIKY